jgi:hypothetical protein
MHRKQSYNAFLHIPGFRGQKAEIPMPKFCCETVTDKSNFANVL